MRVLIVTKIFPNCVEPLSSPFNRQQFKALSELCDLDVMATIPWFPGATAFKKWSAAGRLSGVPQRETVDGIDVLHPRTLFVPKLGHAISGPLYAASLARTVLDKKGEVDVVLGSWAYPDGYAAVRLAQLLGVPAVVKLHGSDMNVVARLTGPQRRLEWALPRAARVVAVSRPLASAATKLGADPARIDLVPNGVDTATFRPRDRREARRRLGLDAKRRLILFVGRLEAAKGALDLLDAFEKLAARDPDVDVALVGDGSAREECEARAAAHPGRIIVAGAQPLERVAEWLAASDLLCLPSWNEGMPNVVLEALASGRRVVASRVGGIPDALSTPKLGELVAPRDIAALADALSRAAHSDYDPEDIVRIAGSQSWEESAQRLYCSLEAAVSESEVLAA